MRKIIIVVLMITLPILAAACSKNTKSVDVVDSIAAAQDLSGDETTAVSTGNDADATGGWGGDELEAWYSGAVNDMGILGDIVSSKEVSKYFNEVTEPNKWNVGRDSPHIYRAIMHFGIPEERFREENNRWMEFYKEHGEESAIFTEEEISALYCGDKDEMNRRLMSPYSFYTGERVLSAFEVMMLDVDTIVAADIDPDALYEYCNRMLEEIPNVPEADVEWYENKLDEMYAKIEEARPLMHRPDTERNVDPDWYVRDSIPEWHTSQDAPEQDVSEQDANIPEDVEEPSDSAAEQAKPQKAVNL